MKSNATMQWAGTKSQHLALGVMAAAVAAAGSASAQSGTPLAATPTPASAGIANDWLRSQSDKWNAWDLGVQFRTRFEARENMAVAGVAGAIDFRDHGAPNSNDYWLFRTKPHLGWKPEDWLGVYVEGRDSFSLHDRRSPDLEADRMDLHQACINVGNPKEFPLSLKVGRQELSYGDERLIGAFDWNNLQRVFDAAKLRYDGAGFWVDSFVSRVVVPREAHFNMPNDYDYFWGTYASSAALIDWQETQLYFLGRNAGLGSPTATTGNLQPLATPRDIYTVGVRFKSLPERLNGWDYTLEAAGQFGRYKETAASPSLAQQAFAVAAVGGYTWKQCDLKPRLGVEYDFSSGDSDPTDNKHETFDNLFPTNHKFYGFMDFFSWQNLHDVRFNGAMKPAKGLTLTLDYHLFWLADTADYFYQANGAARTGGGVGTGYTRNSGNGNFAGSEIDLVASYALKSWANVQAGYGHFFVGDYVKQSLSSPSFGAADANWVYVQASLNF